MEQLVIFSVVGAIGLVKWVMEKSAEQRAKRETEERIGRLGESQPVAHPMQAPRPMASPYPDTAARRLREALGLPDESELPPLRKPPVVRQPPVFRVEEIQVVPPADLEQRMMMPSPPPVPQRMSSRPIPDVQPETTAVPRSSLDELLRSRDGLRKAILVQEILGTPKGLVF